MTNINFDMVQTLAVAAFVLYAGGKIKSHVKVLQKYFIPAPVIGGILASVIIMCLRHAEVLRFSFDTTLQSLFMSAFFTTVGFMASFKLLLQGGIGVVVMLFVSAILLVSQNALGCSLASLFGLDPKFGLMVGSVSLTGGHGTVGAFGATIESSGVKGALTAGFAAATFGLVAGCIIGGPVGRYLLLRHKIQTHDDKSENEIMEEEVVKEVVGPDIHEDPFSGHNFMKSAVCIAVAMGAGSVVAPVVKQYTSFFMDGGLILPGYIGPMLIAALMRNILDYLKKGIPMIAIDAIGSVSLSIFLSMAMMTMKLWELAELALPIITILFAQTLLVILFVVFVTYNFMRRKVIGTDYDSAVICTGHCGFGMGSTPTAMANMTSFCEVNGFSTRAFFIIPLIGSLFIDFINAMVISIYINIL